MSHRSPTTCMHALIHTFIHLYLCTSTFILSYIVTFTLSYIQTNIHPSIQGVPEFPPHEFWVHQDRTEPFSNDPDKPPAKDYWCTSAVPPKKMDQRNWGWKLTTKIPEANIELWPLQKKNGPNGPRHPGPAPAAWSPFIRQSKADDLHLWPGWRLEIVLILQTVRPHWGVLRVGVKPRFLQGYWLNEFFLKLIL
jgi:hypothetical protein